MNTVWTTT